MDEGFRVYGLGPGALGREVFRACCFECLVWGLELFGV